MQATKGINFDDINYEKSFKTTQVYAQSKLANILHAKELARKLENSGISVHVLHPGVIMTELSRHFEKWIPSFINFLTLPIARFIFKTPFHGAQTTLFCVLDDSLEGQSGKYYADCGEAKTSGKYAQDAEYAKKFWRFSEELISNKKTQ